MNHERFLTKISLARTESATHSISEVTVADPGILNLAGGLPNPKLFPFKKAELETTDGHVIKIEGREMEYALQYSASQGIPSLQKWIWKLHKKYHDPPLMKKTPAEGGFSAIVTNGCQDGLLRVFDMLLSPGDKILTDNPVYAGTLAMLKPMDCEIVPVATDERGMNPDSLLEVMSRWTPEDARDPNSGIPKVLYTIPNSSNPTGASATLERKKRIYEIAQKYDLVIVEDDAYFYIQFNDFVPSYQSLDTDGRVLRGDSMSKMVSSGLRIGWISGAEPFIRRLIFQMQCSTLHNSTFVQMMVSGLLEHWGLPGFHENTIKVQNFYRSRRDAMGRCLKKHLSELAEWNEPQGGMFFWIRLKPVPDTTTLAKKTLLLDKRVAVLPGSVFEAGHVTSRITAPYLRCSYSYASDDEMDEAFRRLAELLREGSSNGM